MRVQAHEGTTANVGALYPWYANPGLGTCGAPAGFDLMARSTFCFDQFALYPHVLTNPNILVAGEVGKGKSGFVKTFSLRWMAGRKRQVVVIDPKGEYPPLAEELGEAAAVFALGAESGLCLNVLDRMVAGDRQVDLLKAILGSRLHRSVTEREALALELAHAAAHAVARELGRQPTLGDVQLAMLHPDPARLALAGLTDVRAFVADTMDASLALRALCTGRLAHTLNGQTTEGLNMSQARLIVFDLFSERESEDLGVLMVAVAAWMQGATARGDDLQRMVIFDEAWKCIQDPRIALWLRGQLKLCREGRGTSYVLAVHRFGDMSAVGAAGSEQREVAQGLLSDVGTRILFSLSAGDAAAAQQALGLSDCERETLTHLRKFTALWRVGGRTFLVRQRLAGAMERRVVENGMEPAA